MKIDFEKIENAISNETNFRDVLNRKIQIKDVVSYLKYGCHEMRLGVVIGFTKAGIRLIEFNNDQIDKVSTQSYNKNKFCIINEECKNDSVLTEMIKQLQSKPKTKNNVQRLFTLIKLESTYTAADLTQQCLTIENEEEFLKSTLAFSTKYIPFDYDHTSQSIKKAFEENILNHKDELSEYYLYTEKQGFISVKELTSKYKPVIISANSEISLYSYYKPSAFAEELLSKYYYVNENLGSIYISRNYYYNNGHNVKYFNYEFRILSTTYFTKIKMKHYNDIIAFLRTKSK